MNERLKCEGETVNARMVRILTPAMNSVNPNLLFTVSAGGEGEDEDEGLDDKEKEERKRKIYVQVHRRNG